MTFNKHKSQQFINTSAFSVSSVNKRSNDMMVIYDSIFKRQHKQMRKISIPLWKHSTDRYRLNILIIIAIIYQIYIACELNNVAYTKNDHVEQELISSTMDN